MEKQRKNTIVQEIKYWKENRLLPEQYCNYLLALYTEGEDSEKSAKPERNSAAYLFLAVLIPMFVPITFLVIYFTEMSIDLQMVLILFFAILSLCGYFVFRKEHFFIHIPIIVTALLVLLLSLKWIELSTFSPTLVVIIIGLQAIGWFLIGYIKRWYYLNAAAIISIILFFGITILK